MNKDSTVASLNENESDKESGSIFMNEVQSGLESAGIMGEPTLTVADDPFIALAELHAQLYGEVADTINGAITAKDRESLATIVQDTRQEHGTVLNLTVTGEAVKGEKTSRNFTFHIRIYLDRIRGWRKLVFRKASTNVNKRETKEHRDLEKVKSKIGKLILENYVF